jgi:hypothetical protein
MTPHEYCTNWRQVRVFIKDFRIQGFVEFNKLVLLPLVTNGLTTGPFFLSQYACSDQDDPHDTNLGELPPNYRRPDGNHHSIRIRFQATEGVDAMIENVLPPKPADCWFDHFRDYDIVHGLSGDRFSDYAPVALADHERRAQIVGEILHNNTRFYLDNIRTSPVGDAIFETNPHVLNAALKTPLQSVLHMILNPYEADRNPPKTLGQVVMAAEVNGQNVGFRRL